MSDPTPLTEEEREALGGRLQTALAVTGRGGTAPEGIPFRSGFERGFLAARDFYSERERALREALIRAAEGLDLAVSALRNSGSNQNAEFAEQDSREAPPPPGGQ